MGRKRPIAVFDFETDPFLYDRVPEPFCWGFYDGTLYTEYWGEDCVAKLIEHIRTLPQAYYIYAHNGGRFDFMFALRDLVSDARIVNGRIIEASIGIQSLRDSWAIIPMSLDRFTKSKGKIDYAKMEKPVRHLHRAEISTYMKLDCTLLYDAVTLSQETFGQRLTIGGTAMRELAKFHKVEKADRGTDAIIRQFYFGGRCQAFEAGVLSGSFEMYDINSSYPNVMKNYRHPISASWDKVHVRKSISKNTAFAIVDAENDGVLPIRDKLGINFTTERGVFFASSHEIEAGLNLGRLRIKRVLQVYDYEAWGTFEEFVDHFYGKRLEARDAGFDWQVELFKLILNSGYGKFAQNSDGFEEFMFGERDVLMPPEQGCINDPGKCGACYDKCKSWKKRADNGQSVLWARPSFRGSFYNIATGASITAAARAELLIGLSNATRPIYCDTDSIICESFSGATSPSELGWWKLEKTGDRLAVAGKKVYAMFLDGKCVKKANKGFKAEPEEIVRIAEGEALTFKNDPPTFDLKGDAKFIKRTIKRTANAKAF